MVDATGPADGTTVLLVGDRPARSPTVQRCGGEDPERLAELLERIRIELRRRQRHPETWHRNLLIVFHDPRGLADRLPERTAALMALTLEELRAGDPKATRITTRVEENEDNEGKEPQWRR